MQVDSGGVGRRRGHMMMMMMVVPDGRATEYIFIDIQSWADLIPGHNRIMERDSSLGLKTRRAQ